MQGQRAAGKIARYQQRDNGFSRTKLNVGHFLREGGSLLGAGQPGPNLGPSVVVVPVVVYVSIWREALQDGWNIVGVYGLQVGCNWQR